MKIFFNFLLVAFLVLIPVQTKAQNLTLEDYQRTKSFMYNNYNNKTPFNLYTSANWKPTNFDPSKKYPFIDHTYTEPHTQMFPKSFDKGGIILLNLWQEKHQFGILKCLINE